ncbi:hypothetical protein Cgig2_000102 [Carnegiea gigantea]|uniref:Uncharacterized protein n=1 Tax=Carnegiea gigantea TaxID=171969 RepID=A0A9Q1KZR6_9CARY|nr:hypothetical protein Cgig2_000102 [Carnegiea gigantea]
MEELANHSHERDVDHNISGSFDSYQDGNRLNMDPTMINNTKVTPKETLVGKNSPSSGVTRSEVNTTKVSNSTGRADMKINNFQANNMGQRAFVEDGMPHSSFFRNNRYLTFLLWLSHAPSVLRRWLSTLSATLLGTSVGLHFLRRLSRKTFRPYAQAKSWLWRRLPRTMNSHSYPRQSFMQCF